MSKDSTVKSVFSKNLGFLRKSRMKACRQAKDLKGASAWTQESIGKKIGVSRAVYHTYETGKNEPSLDTLKNISKFYSISIDDLLTVNLKSQQK